MIKTLQIGDEWPLEREGGLARFYFELLRHLPPEMASSNGLVVGGEGVAQSTQGKVVAFARPDAPLASRLLALRRNALATIKREHIDLIACHFALYGFPVADRLAAMPSVVHFQGPWSGESDVEGGASLGSRAKAAMERVVYSRATLLITLSQSFQQELSRRYGVAEERIRVVPAGVDAERFNMQYTRAEARERMGWPADRPVLLTVRRLVRRMGLEKLVEAAKLIVQTQPDALFLIGGSGPLTNELQQRITELGLQDNVRLLGRIENDDLPVAYRAADMTVVPTQALEGFGLITLESLASGTPVFVTAVGGLPEVVRPFAPDCVFPDVSAEAIASTLRAALAGEIALPTEAACRAYAVDNYSWNDIARRVLGVYQEALQRKS
jgi:glycosyltransferase involved in cell wall biosynthesis